MFQKSTRGSGRLEGFLAYLRARKAALLLSGVEKGRILDLGCGSYPYFLSQIDFRERTGIDKSCQEDVQGIEIIQQNVSPKVLGRFTDDSFNAVTALAFFEHINGEETVGILKEAYRILKPGGVLVITVPHKRNDIILRNLAKLGLVSREEIDEHQQLYTKEMLMAQLAKAGFPLDKIKIGLFELGLNIYCQAFK